MKITWEPSVDYIIALFNDQIKSGTLMNRKGLMSTLDKVKWGLPFKGQPSIWEKVAILYKDLIDGHYFSDGNKRIGSLMAYIYLSKNGFEFSPPIGEILSFTLEVAQGTKSEKEILDWFKTNSRKIE
ncbi:MAG: type II toxin-antitoxin system death-on-curing family toxin [Promethearchaeota archaeon]